MATTGRCGGVNFQPSRALTKRHNVWDVELSDCGDIPTKRIIVGLAGLTERIRLLFAPTSYNRVGDFLCFKGSTKPLESELLHLRVATH